MTQPYSFTRIGYAYVPTTNLDSSIDWYTRNLSFALMSKFEDRGSNLAVLHHPHVHAIALLLIETTDKQSLEIARNGKPFPILALNCPDIEHTHAQLQANGVDVGELQQLGNGEAKSFFFRDDQGNFLEATWSIWDPLDELKSPFPPVEEG